MKKHIPNLLTIGNLLTGSIGIVFLFTSSDWHPAWFIWIACLFDFMDGFTARALKVTSPIGKELDSLADVISFGLFPAIFMFRFLEQSQAGWMAWCAFFLCACAAFRLAKFNTDSRQTSGFIGLPTPAHALFITGLPDLINLIDATAHNLLFGFGSVVMIGFLMTSELKMPALKFNTFSWKENRLTYTLLLTGLFTIVLFKEAGIPLAILIYIILSFFSAKSKNQVTG